MAKAAVAIIYQGRGWYYVSPGIKPEYYDGETAFQWRARIFARDFMNVNMEEEEEFMVHDMLLVKRILVVDGWTLKMGYDDFMIKAPFVMKIWAYPKRGIPFDVIINDQLVAEDITTYTVIRVVGLRERLSQKMKVAQVVQY